MGWSNVLIGLIMALSVVNSGGAGRIDRANQGPRYADSVGLPQNPDVAYRLALIDGSDAILREVLHRFPDHPRAKEVLARLRAREDDAAYEKAAAAGTVAAIEAYLRAWPQGRHQQTARETAARLRTTTAAEAPSADGPAAKTEIMVSTSHSSYVWSVAFTPDNRLLASASSDGTIKLWDNTGSRLIRTFAGHSGELRSVAISPDGKALLSAGGEDASLKLWEAATGRLIHTFTGHELDKDRIGKGGDVVAAFSPDGKRIISGGADRTIRIWDTASGALIRKIDDRKGIYTLAVSSDGRWVATGSLGMGIVRMWDVETGQLVRHFGGQEEGLPEESDIHAGVKSVTIFEVAFSPDGNRIYAVASDDTMRVWDRATAQSLHVVKTGGRLYSVAPAPDGRSVAIGGRREVKLWDPATAQIVKTLPGRSWEYGGLTFSPDGRWLVGSGMTLTMKEFGGNAVIDVWDMTTGTNVSETTPGAGAVRSVAYAPDNSFIAAGTGDATIQLWESATGRLARTLDDVPQTPLSLRFSADSRQILAGLGDNSARLWDAATGRPVQTFAGGHTSPVYTAVFSPDGARIATGSRDGTAKVWAVDTGKVLFPLETLDQTVSSETTSRYIHSIAYTPDGALIAAGLFLGRDDEDKKREKILIWDAATGRLVRKIPGHSEGEYAIAFSPDGKLIAAAGYDRTIQLWELATGRLVRTFPGHERWVTSLAFSPDGRLIASGGYDGLIRVWEAETGRQVHAYAGQYSSKQDGTEIALAFSPDGRRLVSGSFDATITLQDLDAGKPLLTFLGGKNNTWLTITRDGFFAGSIGERPSITLVRGLETYAVQQVYDHLYRPDLVETALKGDPAGRYRDAAFQLNLNKVLESGAPPQIDLLEKRTEQRDGTVQATVRITDLGGGIGGKLVWRVNGRTQGSLTAPGSDEPSRPGRTLTTTQTFKVDPAQANAIEVTAYNRAGLLASAPLRFTLEAFGAARDERPRMHVLAIGVEQYAMPDLRLRYATKDAKTFAESLKAAGESIFSEVAVTTVIDREATREGIGRAFQRLAEQIEPQDVFVLFVGGHGRSIAGRYYFVQQDLDFAKGQSIEGNAIGQDEWQTWLAGIPAQKSLLILDTCESASAAGLVRGLQRERETAMDQLRNATGQNLIAAARQAAYEGYKGHGVLTYALIEALTRTGESRTDERVHVAALASHAVSRVPHISQELFGVAQVPFLRLSGESFVLAERKLAPMTARPQEQCQKGFVLMRNERLREQARDDAPGATRLNAPSAVDVLGNAGEWVLIGRNCTPLGHVPASSVQQLR